MTGTDSVRNPSAGLSGTGQSSEIQEQSALNFSSRQCFLDNQVMGISAHEGGRGASNLGAASFTEPDLFF